MLCRTPSGIDDNSGDVAATAGPVAEGVSTGEGEGHHDLTSLDTPPPDYGTLMEAAAAAAEGAAAAGREVVDRQDVVTAWEVALAPNGFADPKLTPTDMKGSIPIGGGKSTGGPSTVTPAAAAAAAATTSVIERDLSERRFPGLPSQFWTLLTRGIVKYARAFWPVRILGRFAFCCYV